jgi:hypothetical protein
MCEFHLVGLDPHGRPVRGTTRHHLTIDPATTAGETKVTQNFHGTVHTGPGSFNSGPTTFNGPVSSGAGAEAVQGDSITVGTQAVADEIRALLEDKHIQWTDNRLALLRRDLDVIDLDTDLDEARPLIKKVIDVTQQMAISVAGNAAYSGLIHWVASPW